jgi:predicted CxxxxCH...CXXCH cytochrome family protein
MPPTDAATRDINTGGFVGNHSEHAPAAAVATDCTVCHGNSGYTTSHRSDAINFNANIGGNSPLVGKYAGGITFKNQTSVVTLATCSSVNCHFEATTPTWGAAALTVSAANCAVCHGNSPADGNHPAGSGVGKKHGDYYGTDQTSCVKCHPNHTAEAKPFQHASSASQRALILTFTAAPNNGAGTPTYSKTANLAYPAYLPSQTIAANRNGTCTNMYCHSDGRSLAATLTTNTTATWGSTLTCAGCHKADGTAAVAMATDKHAIHVASDTGYNYGCVKCHNATVSNNTTISNLANHVNQSVNVAFNNTTTAVNGKYNNVASPMSKGVNTAKGYCSNVYCHSNGTLSTGTFVAMSSAKWDGTMPANCTGCHGGNASVAANRRIVTGSHSKHMAGGTSFSLGCAACHSATVSGDTTLSNKANHVNYKVDVAMATGTYSATGHKPGAAVGTCSTNYCHSNGKGAYGAAPTWGLAASGACGTCHATLPTIGGASTIGSGNGSAAHFIHFSSNTLTNYGPQIGTAGVAACQQCHTYTAENGVTHVNNAVDVASTCTTSCHKQIAPANITTAWAAGPVTCESCHTGTLSVINGITAPDKSLFATAGHGTKAVGKGGACVDCHDKNSRHIDRNAATHTNRLLGALVGTLNTECNYCHNNTSVVTTTRFQNMSTHVTVKGGTQAAGYQCIVCHDAHGTTNLSMINTTIGGYTINYTNRSTGWVDTVTNRGLCQVCHTLTNHFKAGVAEASHPTTDCFNCHLHGAKGGAFKPNGNCDSCHGYPPVPKAVAGLTFGTVGNYENGKFEDYSGGGGAHVTSGHIPLTAKASQGWANCDTCHFDKDASHAMITPIKTHISSVTVKVNPTRMKFNNAQFITYSGAKLVNTPGANKSGSCYNVSCHFQKSPRWSIQR